MAAKIRISKEKTAKNQENIWISPKNVVSLRFEIAMLLSLGNSNKFDCSRLLAALHLCSLKETARN